MKKKLCLVLALSIPAYCTADALGTIARVAVRDTAVYITMSPRAGSRAACATNSSWDYAFPIVSDGGKGKLSLALTAYSTKATVNVQSLDSCTTYSNMQDIDYLILED